MKIKFTKGNQTKEYELVVIGDLNGDGKTKNSDLITLVRYKVGLKEDLKEVYKMAADANRDGKYGTDGDIITLVRVLVDLISL